MIRRQNLLEKTIMLANVEGSSKREILHMIWIESITLEFASAHLRDLGTRKVHSPACAGACVTQCVAESEEELKNLVMRVKEESAKNGLKLNIKKTKIMATGPISSWQIEGEDMEAVTDFTFLGSMITADGDSSHEIKRRLFLGRKAMTNLDSILKKQGHHLANKSPHSQSYGFPCSDVWK